MDKLKKLRRNFQKFKSSGGYRYPESLKREAVQALESGVKRKDLLKAIEVNTHSLRKWRKDYSSFSKVEVLPPAIMENKYTIESPNGFLIHGLTKSDLIDLFTGRSD